MLRKEGVAVNNNQWYSDRPGGGRPQGEQPGRSDAVTSLVLGVASLLLWCFGYTAIGSVVLGIIGLVYARKAREAGFEGSLRTAGHVCSLIGLIGGCFVLLMLVLFGAAIIALLSGMFGHFMYF